MTRSPLRLTALLALLALVLGPLLTGPTARADPGDPVGVWPLWPVPDVVRAFDPPSSPYASGHRGVDLAGHVGQQVRTALPGTVLFAGRIAGRGVVVVGHGATRTTYEPVAAAVTVGARLPAGAPIGTLQLPGSHCLPRACLHWGWIAGETYLDPLRLVRAGPVRLLPLWRDRPAGHTGPPLGAATAARAAGAADDGVVDTTR
ncbi:peptidoglycan DD-metalloendopeptidase family protein [Nocardioides nitrophenolicus]|uniref:peptidoglycan DD-metalloendopeptidase family protein n=1 Tax=Nocardioides nitrophenolicus TaxID=60489 RepID=UPI00195C894F|nr:peptidoglycan DD-metalloendopeptidase family protein [Nocardioides nitrophenolicus]MBM7519583.1 murein DD-endopeptidase MepM/ murein hydrolase activator NlpD [Nocardioides nitrophenolicus]